MEKQNYAPSVEVKDVKPGLEMKRISWQDTDYSMLNKYLSLTDNYIYMTDKNQQKPD